MDLILTLPEVGKKFYTLTHKVGHLRQMYRQRHQRNPNGDFNYKFDWCHLRCVCVWNFFRMEPDVAMHFENFAMALKNGISTCNANLGSAGLLEKILWDIGDKWRRTESTSLESKAAGIGNISWNANPTLTGREKE